ncbi:PP2C family protein-serine/threonine phosphatase [Streptomyces olivaceus]|uniref:PP2C family protein-serine/threonine phosphatase n=1 Tax=Streptomyces TaxID=1883 RepID=UPI001FB6D249|nr:PP2C family protein-serine/threonine phosphatase [Streptomyces sp. CB09030]UOG78407.1 serine/threonine-protein phosphatase [Streptomyces sp. CB09030]
MSRPPRQHSAAPTASRETVQPPRTGQLLLGMVTVTLLVALIGSLANSVMALVGLLVFLPAAAAALCTVRQTALVCAWTALLGSTAFLTGGSDVALADRVLLLVLTACLIAASLYACRRRIHREHTMVRLHSAAVAMQQQILRPLPLLTEDVRVAGVYEPVQEDRLVGGDIYDVVESAWGTRVLIGDVQGKGLAAVGAAFAVIGSFREAAHREPTLTALVDALDASVTRHNSSVARDGDDERFVTVLVLNIDARDGVQAVNCGHVPPQLIATHSVTTPPLDNGVPLGLAALTTEPVRVGRFPFPGDTTLLLSTDGLTESRAADGAFYPLPDRLAALGTLPPSDLPRALQQDAHAYAGKTSPHDDIAILTVRRRQRLGRQ